MVLIEEFLQEIKETMCISRVLGCGVKVTGTPSTGKSYFLHYVAHTLISQKKEVFIWINDDQFHYKNGKKLEIADTSCLSDPSVIRLADPASGINPLKESIAPTILFVSPTAERYKHYHDKKFLSLCMPPWELSELEECFKLCYGGRFTDSHRKRYDQWGGVIYPVLFPFFAKTYKTSLERFLTSNELMQNVLNAVTDKAVLTDNLGPYQWVLHMCPVVLTDGTIDYKHWTMALGGQVLEAIMERMQKFN